MKDKNKKAFSMLALFAVAAVAFLALGTAPAAANNDVTEHKNVTVDVNEDVEELRAYAENTNGTTLDVTFYGIDSDGETEVQATTLTADNTTNSVSQTVNSSKYDSYRVVVSGGEAEAVEIKQLEETAVGGGFLGGMNGYTPLLGGIAVLALAAEAYRRNQNGY